MEIKIGLIQALKELEIEISDDLRDEVIEEIKRAFSENAKVLWLTDKKGKKFAIATERLAYLEIDPISSERRVGFGTS
jgi:hypothetical protein